MHLIFFKYSEKTDAYYPTQAGFNIVPNGVVDKVLPVDSNVCRQFEKVYFKNGKLRVRESMTLLNDSDLDAQDLRSIADVGVPFENTEENTVKVEL